MRDDLKTILTNFFDQAETNDIGTSQYPRFYSGLLLKVGFGVGRPAQIPWIAFLAKDQKVMNGIFPVYYFFKEHHKLILAYGISEAEKPNKFWKIPVGSKTILQYFHQFGKQPYKYGLSYVFKVYNSSMDMDWEKMNTELNDLLSQYKQLMQIR